MKYLSKGRNKMAFIKRGIGKIQKKGKDLKKILKHDEEEVIDDSEISIEEGNQKKKDKQRRNNKTIKERDK